MNIELTYDPSVASAPAGFKTALNYVVNFLDTTFTNPVTLTIDVGWGEVDGQSIDSSTLGESIESVAPAYSYTQLRNALIANATSVTAAAAVATLPVSDPTGGASFDTGTAEAKALGLPGSEASIDGWIGFSNTSNTFAFDPNNRAVLNEYDFIAVALHEITEVMGRDADLGSGPFSSTSYTPLDLFRYASPGIRDLTDGGKHSSAYFSVNSGSTNLDNFNTDPNGDFGDWADNAGNDAFLAFANTGVTDAFGSTDLAVMEALGWTPSSAASSLNEPNVVNFVQQVYEAVLFRSGSSNDANAWASAVDQASITANQLVADFVASPETQSLVLPIVRLYQAFFGRAPDPGGLGAWVNALRGGESLNAIAGGFVGAPEFQQHYGANLTPTAFVTALYENVLGRAPDSAGEQSWLAVLGPTPTAATEAAVAVGFAQSTEFQTDSTGPIDSWLTAAALSGAYGSSIAYASTSGGGSSQAVSTGTPHASVANVAATAHAETGGATTGESAGMSATPHELMGLSGVPDLPPNYHAPIQA